MNVAKISTRVKHSFLIGAIAGLLVFSIFYYMDHSLKYLLFVPFGALMGGAAAYSEKKD